MTLKEYIKKAYNDGKKAIESKFFLGIVVIIFLLCLANTIGASVRQTENFDSYNNGDDLENVGLWGEVSVGDPAEANNVVAVSGALSGSWWVDLDRDRGDWTFIYPVLQGSISGKIYILECPSQSNIGIGYASTTLISYFNINHNNGFGCRIEDNQGTGFHTVATTTWYDWEVEWDLALNSQTKLTFDSSTTDWQDANNSTFDGVDMMRFIANDIVYWLDDLSVDSECDSSCTGCGYSACEQLSSFCQWNFPSASCEPIPTGQECGSGFNCYACITENTCESYGCYWEDGWCSYYPPTESTTTQWLTYYGEKSEFTTPTDFATNLASSSQAFFGLMRQQLLTFGQIFNTESAREMGSTTGSYWPRLLGLLEIIDDIFGGLPVATISFFVLALLFVVIAIRVSARIWNFVKFW